MFPWEVYETASPSTYLVNNSEASLCLGTSCPGLLLSPSIARRAQLCPLPQPHLYCSLHPAVQMFMHLSMEDTLSSPQTQTLGEPGERRRLSALISHYLCSNVFQGWALEHIPTSGMCPQDGRGWFLKGSPVGRLLGKEQWCWE